MTEYEEEMQRAIDRQCALDMMLSDISKAGWSDSEILDALLDSAVSRVMAETPSEDALGVMSERVRGAFSRVASPDDMHVR